MVPNDIQTYCNCMERVRHHVSVADEVLAGRIDTRLDELNTQLIFLQFRNALEEIAFSSLSANRAQYAAARPGFATEWNARRILGFVENVNPNFYPVPVQPPRETAPGQRDVDRVQDGFLTRDDFVDLYDISAEVLHCRNPFNPGDFAIDFRYPVDRWSGRIKALLSWHFVQLPHSNMLWLVNVSNDRLISAWPLGADGPFVVD
jgi:hypothetical protein